MRTKLTLTPCLLTSKRAMKAKKLLLSPRVWAITYRTYLLQQEPTCFKTSRETFGSSSSSNTMQLMLCHLWRWRARKQLRMLWDAGVRSCKCLGLCQNKTRSYSTLQQLFQAMKIMKVAMSKTSSCRWTWTWAVSRVHQTKSTWLCRTKLAATNLR